MKWIFSVLLELLTLSGTPASAQWAKQLDPVVPRTRDGKLDLAARPPRAPDGKVDLSGVWLPQPDPTGKPQNVENIVVPRYFTDVMTDLKPGDVSIQPWATALLKERVDSHGRLSPSSRCQPTGVPAAAAVPLPYKIIQTPQVIVILYEENNIFRQIFLDGRSLPKDPDPRWMGYSVGRWEGDTLVVDSSGFREGGWLDRMGHPHSSDLHVIERFRRDDIGNLEIDVTIDDPKAYSKPFTYTLRQGLIPDQDLYEYFCTENEKDVEHFK
jgi:hypothetical protein